MATLVILVYAKNLGAIRNYSLSYSSHTQSINKFSSLDLQTKPTMQLFLIAISVFLHLFNTFLLSNHYVPGIVLSAWNMQ